MFAMPMHSVAMLLFFTLSTLGTFAIQITIINDGSEP